MIASFVFSKIDDFGFCDEVLYFFVETLDKACDDYKLEHRFLINTDSFCLEVCGDDTDILEFANHISRVIPLSLQWCFRELKVILEFSADSTTKIHHNFDVSRFINPLEISKITNIDSEYFCDLWGDFVCFKQSKMQLFKNNTKLEIHNKESLKEKLQEISRSLINGDSVFVKTIFGKKEIILFKEDSSKVDGDYIFMPFCLNSLQTIFRVKQEELQALATIEKPIITLKPKSVFKNLLGDDTKCILPFEPLLILLVKFLPDYSGLYLRDIGDSKKHFGVCYFVPQDFKEAEISVGSNSLILKHNFCDSSFANEAKRVIVKNNLLKTCAIYLGRDKSSVFVYFDTSFKEPIKFAYETNLNLIFNELKIQSETTSKLYNNFKKENESLCNAIDGIPSVSKYSSNLLHLVGVCGVLLNLGECDEDLYEVSQRVFTCASEFMGEKGPRIDFKLVRDLDNKIHLDTFKTIRSVMSFKLAGVERELLCFGILDSLAEFFANFARDMNENYQLKDVIICGEMFLNKQFLDKFIHYYAKNNEIFPCEVMEFKE